MFHNSMLITNRSAGYLFDDDCCTLPKLFQDVTIKRHFKSIFINTLTSNPCKCIFSDAPISNRIFLCSSVSLDRWSQIYKLTMYLSSFRKHNKTIKITNLFVISGIYGLNPACVRNQFARWRHRKRVFCCSVDGCELL